MEKKHSYGKVFNLHGLFLPLQFMQSSCLADCDRDTDSGVSVCCVKPKSASDPMLAPFESGKPQKRN